MKFPALCSKRPGKRRDLVLEQGVSSAAEAVAADADEAAVGCPAAAEGGSAADERALVEALQAQVASLSQSLEEEKSERQAEVARERRLRERLQRRYETTSLCGGEAPPTPAPGPPPAEWHAVGTGRAGGAPLPPPPPLSAGDSAIEVLLGVTCGVRFACDEEDELPAALGGCARGGGGPDALGQGGYADHADEEEQSVRRQLRSVQSSIDELKGRPRADLPAAPEPNPWA